MVTWAGTAVNGLLAILLTSAGLEAEVHDVGVTAVNISPAELTAVLGGLERCPPVEDLASYVEGLRTAKLDDFVDEELLRRLWAVRHAKHRDRVTAILRQLTQTG
ncbi:hypothetical protein ACVOMT_15960 [Sphingomonas panni]